MQEFHITSGFNYDLQHVLGRAIFTEEALEKIVSLIEKGALMEFAISFMGEPQDDGTYKNVELIGLSMIPARKQ